MLSIMTGLSTEVFGLDDPSMSSSHCLVVLTSLSVWLSSLWASPLLLFSAKWLEEEKQEVWRTQQCAELILASSWPKTSGGKATTKHFVTCISSKYLWNMHPRDRMSVQNGIHCTHNNFCKINCTQKRGIRLETTGKHGWLSAIESSKDPPNYSPPSSFFSTTPPISSPFISVFCSAFLSWLRSEAAS